MGVTFARSSSSARMAGAMGVGELVHALESQVGMAIEAGREDEDSFGALCAADAFGCGPEENTIAFAIGPP